MKNLKGILIMIGLVIAASFSYGQSNSFTIINNTREEIEFNVYTSYCGGGNSAIVDSYTVLAVPGIPTTIAPNTPGDSDLKWYAYEMQGDPSSVGSGADHNPYIIINPVIADFWASPLTVTWLSGSLGLKVNY